MGTATALGGVHQEEASEVATEEVTVVTPLASLTGTDLRVVAVTTSALMIRSGQDTTLVPGTSGMTPAGPTTPPGMPLAGSPILPRCEPFHLPIVTIELLLPGRGFNLINLNLNQFSSFIIIYKCKKLAYLIIKMTPESPKSRINL